MKPIYLDHNASTFVSPRVLATLSDLEGEVYGNPASPHSAGRKAKKILNLARESVASSLGALESEILFSSGGTESINHALIGTWFARPAHKNTILSSPLEHSATLKTLEFLQVLGARITWLQPDSSGRLSLQEICEKITEDTLLVSLLWANNEIGNLYPIEEIGSLCRKQGALFHTDAVQAAGKMKIDLARHKIDLLSFSGHKFHGPKGVGGLYVRKGVLLKPIHFGGAQERGLRAGTPDVVRLYGMAMALEDSVNHLEENTQNLQKLRHFFEEKVREKIPSVRVIGDLEKRLPNTSNLYFEGVDGELLLMKLDLEGICASMGSACESGSIDPSHVILGLGFDPKQAKSCLRFSFAISNTTDEIDRVVAVLAEQVRN